MGRLTLSSLIQGEGRPPFDADQECVYLALQTLGTWDEAGTIQSVKSTVVLYGALAELYHAHQSFRSTHAHHSSFRFTHAHRSFPTPVKTSIDIRAGLAEWV